MSSFRHCPHAVLHAVWLDPGTTLITCRALPVTAHQKSDLALLTLICHSVSYINCSIHNRDMPVEESGDLEIGGIGSHGEPWNSPLQYEERLLSTNNVTIRGCYFSGGDDNIAIKNDTANVLIEDCVFGNGHGASIGVSNFHRRHPACCSSPPRFPPEL